MAYLTQFICSECRKGVSEVQIGISSSLGCSSCRVKGSNKKKRLHFAALKGLTVEERLDLLEEKIYDLNIDDRLKYLESKHATYA